MPLSDFAHRFFSKHLYTFSSLFQATDVQIRGVLRLAQYLSLYVVSLYICLLIFSLYYYMLWKKLSPVNPGMSLFLRFSFTPGHRRPDPRAEGAFPIYSVHTGRGRGMHAVQPQLWRQYVHF